MKWYVLNDITWEELEAILSFLTAVSDPNLVRRYSTTPSPHICLHPCSSCTARRDPSNAAEPPNQLTLPSHPGGAALGQGDTPARSLPYREHAGPIACHQGWTP